MNKKYYLNQRPVESILFTVTDERGFARNLSSYTGAVLLFSAPNGVVSSPGNAVLVDKPAGRVKFDFAGESIFTVPGRYRVQLKLTNGDRADYADIANIDVEKGL